MRVVVAISLFSPLLLSGCYQAQTEVLLTTATAAAGATSGGTSAGTHGAGTSSGSTGSPSTTSGPAASVGATSGVAATVGTTVGTAVGATGSASATTSSGGSTTSSGGTSGTFMDCPPGQIEIRGSLSRLCTTGLGGAVTGMGTITNQTDATAATVIGDGGFYFCVESGTQINAALQFQSYLPAQFATIDAQESADVGSIPLICSAIAQYLPLLLPGFDASDAVLVVAQSPAAAGTCSTLSGWSYAITDNFNEGLDAGVAAVAGMGIQAGNVTQASGLLLYYNIDPGISGATSFIGSQASFALPDGGSACPNIGDQPPTQLTGGVALQAGVVSYFPYVVP